MWRLFCFCLLVQQRNLENRAKRIHKITFGQKILDNYQNGYNRGMRLRIQVILHITNRSAGVRGTCQSFLVKYFESHFSPCLRPNFYQYIRLCELQRRYISLYIH